MGDRAVGGQKIETVVEVTDPEASGGIGGERRDVAVCEDGRARFKNALPSEGGRIHAIKSVTGDGKHRADNEFEAKHTKCPRVRWYTLSHAGYGEGNTHKPVAIQHRVDGILRSLRAYTSL
jgi:hypothetical protein